ncbi:hypothetical protein V6Z12_A01G164700 [Gossypium hirsutum]
METHFPSTYSLWLYRPNFARPTKSNKIQNKIKLISPNYNKILSPSGPKSKKNFSKKEEEETLAPMCAAPHVPCQHVQCPRPALLVPKRQKAEISAFDLADPAKRTEKEPKRNATTETV